MSCRMQWAVGFVVFGVLFALRHGEISENDCLHIAAVNTVGVVISRGFCRWSDRYVM